MSIFCPTPEEREWCKSFLRRNMEKHTDRELYKFIRDYKIRLKRTEDPVDVFTFEGGIKLYRQELRYRRDEGV